MAWLALVHARAPPGGAKRVIRCPRLKPFEPTPGLQQRRVRQPKPRQLQCGPSPPATYPGRPGRAATRRPDRCRPEVPRCCDSIKPAARVGRAKGVAIWREGSGGTSLGRGTWRAWRGTLVGCRRGPSADLLRVCVVQGYPQMMPQVNKTLHDGWRLASPNPGVASTHSRAVQPAAWKCTLHSYLSPRRGALLLSAALVLATLFSRPLSPAPAPAPAPAAFAAADVAVLSTACAPRGPRRATARRHVRVCAGLESS